MTLNIRWISALAIVVVAVAGTLLFRSAAPPSPNGPASRVEATAHEGGEAYGKPMNPPKVQPVRADPGARPVPLDPVHVDEISGRVLGPDGKPLEWGYILIGPSGGKLTSGIQYGTGGEFRFTKLSGGHYRLVAQPRDWQRRSWETGVLVPAELPDVVMGTGSVEVRLVLGVSLLGRIEVESGFPENIPMWVNAFPPGTGKLRDEDCRGTKVERDGTFSLPGMDSRDSWDLALQAHGAGVGSFLRGVHAGKDGIVLKVEPGLTIAGRVVDEGGAPISGLNLRAVALDARGREAGIEAEASSKSPWIETTDVFPMPKESEESKNLKLGEFVLKGLGRFRFRVTVRTGRTDWAPAAIEATAGSVEPIELRLHPGAVIEGRVIGKWAGTLYVYADPADGNEDGISYSSVQDDGTFRIRGLASGPHRLRMNFHSSLPGARLSPPIDAPATGVELLWE